MKRLLLDTNIYGEMVIDKNINLVKNLVILNNHVLIYGSRIIRNELRDTPKKIKVGNSNLRIDLLCLYDQIVKEHELSPSEEMEKLADEYFQAYREFGGAKGKNELYIDFTIVALASLRGMDIVVSDDDSSMKAELSVKAYQFVNTLKNLEMPKFINYFEFKQLLGGRVTSG